MIRRRLVTVPALFLLFAAVWFGSPVLIVVAALVDSFRWAVWRRPWMAVRLVAFLMAYTLAEAAGLTALGISWMASLGGRTFDIRPATFTIQRLWAGFVLIACRTVFGLRITGSGLEATTPTPFILLARHASIVDNLLPAWFISRPHGTHIRYVMKDELLIDPALDVAGNRLANVFVRRGSGDIESETASIRHLAATMGDDEAVLIYPEGTRFSADKLRRTVSILQRRSPRLGRLAEGFGNVLPPKPAGTLALLEGCSADVVVMAHRGLDGFARVADIWRGAMVRRNVDVAFWRIPRSAIPVGRTERTEWLFDLWRRIDDWIAEPT